MDDDDPILDKELIIITEEEIQEDEVETDILPMIDDEAICPDEINDDVEIFEKSILNYLRDRLISVFKKRVRSKN
jgi:hypothetical protein